MRDAVQGEREDELKYNYLIENTFTQEEKDITTSIRDDEKLHRQWYMDINLLNLKRFFLLFL